MSAPRQAFKRSLKKLYDYLDLNLGIDGALPLNLPSGGDAGKVLAVNQAEDGYELLNDLVLDTLTIGGENAVVETVTNALSDRLDDLEAYAESIADSAIATSGVVVLTKTGVGAYTLALPGAADDGKHLYIIAGTANAHVVTLPSASLYDGTGTPKDTITFDAQIGASVHLVAVNETYCLIGDASTVTLTDEV